MPLFAAVGVKARVNARLDSTVVLVCVCVRFGGTVTVPTLAMDTVF